MLLDALADQISPVHKGDPRQGEKENAPLAGRQPESDRTPQEQEKEGVDGHGQPEHQAHKNG